MEGPLLRYATHLGGDHGRAQDIVQEVFLKLCRANRKHLGQHLDQWLYTVCRNLVLDDIRKDGRMERVISNPDWKERPVPDPHQRVEQQESQSRVLKLMGSLPDRQQEVLRLRFQEGRSYKEIAAITQLSVNHVGVLIHQAIRTLRGRLSPATRGEV